MNKTKSPVFKYIEYITWSKPDLDFSNPEVNKEYDIFILNRFLSMIEFYLPIINLINLKPLPSKKDHYTFLKNIIPKGNPYINYIKKPKSNESISFISKYFDVGKKEAQLYASMMTKKEIDDIVDIFKDGKQ